MFSVIFKKLVGKWDVCLSGWWRDTFGYAFWTCAKHFRVFKPQKQLVLFDNIYGQHSEKWPCMPSLWVKFLPKLAKYDDLIQIDNIAHHWCLKYYHNMRIFDVEHWSYQTRQKGGMSWYCSFSLGFQCETVFSLIFSGNIHINCLGKLKKLLIFK